MATTISDISSSLVTVGQPIEGGCCYTSFAAAPTYPTDAATALGADWVSCGEISDNGYTESKDASTKDFKGWHGSIILSVVDSETNKYKVEFVEIDRESAAKLRYGVGNVSATNGVVTHITGKPGQIAAHPLVFEELESNGNKRRTLVKKAMVTKFDDVPHQKGSLMVYGMEFTAVEVDGSAFDIWSAAPAS